jgi:hypothetical protein
LRSYHSIGKKPHHFSFLSHFKPLRSFKKEGRSGGPKAPARPAGRWGRIYGAGLSL